MSLCQVDKNEYFFQLLIHSINFYEVSYLREYKTKLEKIFQFKKLVNLTHDAKHPYNSGERIKNLVKLKI